jgi:hypothetical protein
MTERFHFVQFSALLEPSRGAIGHLVGSETNV